MNNQQRENIDALLAVGMVNADFMADRWGINRDEFVQFTCSDPSFPEMELIPQGGGHGWKLDDVLEFERDRGIVPDRIYRPFLKEPTHSETAHVLCGVNTLWSINRVGRLWMAIRWGINVRQADVITKQAGFPKNRAAGDGGAWVPQEVIRFEQANGLEVVNP